MPAINYELTLDEVARVEDVLSKDESSHNDELVRHFVGGGLITSGLMLSSVTATTTYNTPNSRD